MEYQEMFKFLKLEQVKRKNADELSEGEKYFYTIYLLDSKNNPCRFFIFNKDLINKVLSLKLQGLQDVVCNIGVAYSNDSWRVNLLDIN